MSPGSISGRGQRALGRLRGERGRMFGEPGVQRDRA